MLLESVQRSRRAKQMASGRLFHAIPMSCSDTKCSVADGATLCQTLSGVVASGPVQYCIEVTSAWCKGKRYGEVHYRTAHNIRKHAVYAATRRRLYSHIMSQPAV